MRTAGPGSGHCISPNGVVNGAGLHCKEYGGSATIMHMPTGLYVYGAYGQKHDEDRFDLVGLGPNRQVDKDDRVFDAKFDAVNTATGISVKIDVDNLDLVQAGAMIKF